MLGGLIPQVQNWMIEQELQGGARSQTNQQTINTNQTINSFIFGLLFLLIV
jgi:hypothetical protein